MISILILLLIYLTFICFGLQDPVIGSAWPSINAALNIPLSYAGYISMIIAAGRLISSILGEKVIRRFGAGLTVSFSALILCASLFGYSFSSSFLMLCVWSFPLSLGVGFVDVSLNNYVALHYKAKHMNWLHCFWSTGASIGPVIMSFYLAGGLPWNAAFRMFAIFLGCLTVLLFAALPLWKKNNPPTALAVNTASAIIDHLPSGDGKVKRIYFKDLITLAGVKQALVLFFCYISLQMTIVFWGSSYLVTVKNILPETAAAWISIYYIGLTSGRLISGFLTIKLNNRQMLRLGYSIIACGIAALLLPFDSASLMPGFLILGIGCAPIFPCLVHETPKNFGSQRSQAIIGIQMASGNAGLLVIPPLLGKTASVFGFNIFPYFLAVLLVTSIIMFEILNKKVDRVKNQAKN